MAYEPTTTEQMLKDAGQDASRVQSVTPEQPYDRDRAYGSSGKDVDPAREAARFGSGSGTPGPNGLVLETRGNDGEYGLRLSEPKRSRGIGGLPWRNATAEVRERPAHHTIAPPTEVARAWAAVGTALEAAEAAERISAELFTEANAASPRAGNWNAVEQGEDKARALLGKARSARATYDGVAAEHLGGEGAWAAAVANAVAPAHAKAVAAVTAAEQACQGLGAAVQAALAAGLSRGEQAANLPHLRPATDALNTASAALSGYDPDKRITEAKLAIWSRKERGEIAAMGDYASQYRLWQLERSEGKKYTNFMAGFVPDMSLLNDRHI